MNVVSDNRFIVFSYQFRISHIEQRQSKSITMVINLPDKPSLAHYDSALFINQFWDSLTCWVLRAIPNYSMGLCYADNNRQIINASFWEYNLHNLPETSDAKRLDCVVGQKCILYE